MDPHVPSPRIQKKCILHARAHGHLAIRTAWHPMFPMPTHRIVLLPHQSLFIFFPRPHHFIPSFTRHHFPITFHFTSITLGHIAGPILILKAPDLLMHAWHGLPPVPPASPSLDVWRIKENRKFLREVKGVSKCYLQPRITVKFVSLWPMAIFVWYKDLYFAFFY